jgi:hypothetical protein
MDPDVALTRLREHVRLVNDPATLPALRATRAEWLAEEFEALDDWLSRGGFPPSAWNRPPLSFPQTLDELHALGRPTPAVAAVEAELDAHPTWCPGDHS